MVDIDGTICTNTNGDYPNAQPILYRINYFNHLYDQGHEVHYWTARGGNSGKDWSELTLQQLKDWGVKYTSLRMNKPAYDVWVDDKAFNVESYFYDSPSNRV
jgi:hypothetical protein